MTSLIQVVGAGQMGVGITHVCLQAGFVVHLIDISQDQRLKAIDKCAKYLSQKDLSRLSHGDQLLLEKTDVIIEAIAENLEIKKTFWRALPSFFATPETTTILASNTSSFSITEIASCIINPQFFMGIHFMNPVPKMALVEVIRGLQTHDQTYDRTLQFIKSLKKEAVTSHDRPGFIVNRILVPMVNEAIFLLDQGVSDAGSIDKAMTLGANHPLGPLALADLIGLDTCLAILKDLHKRLGEDKYRPCPLLEVYVHAGYLGRKTGRGFYVYEEKKGQRVTP